MRLYFFRHRPKSEEVRLAVRSLRSMQVSLTIHQFNSVKNWQDAIKNSEARGVKFERLEEPADFRKKAKVLTGPMRSVVYCLDHIFVTLICMYSGWKGVYNEKAGWTHAYNSLKAVYEECERLGIRFVFGEAGTAISLVTDNRGGVLGVKTEDGSIHNAQKVILACGAWLDSIIDTKGQALAKRWGPLCCQQCVTY